MSTSVSPQACAFGQVRSSPRLDVSLLHELRHRYRVVFNDTLEVLDDEDGAVTRFLCRAPRLDFERAEDFVAAAVKRFFDCVQDQRLREQMYADALAQDFEVEHVPRAEQQRRLERQLRALAPETWVEHLRHPDGLDVVLLTPRNDRLELVACSPRHWLYALLET